MKNSFIQFQCNLFLFILCTLLSSGCDKSVIFEKSQEFSDKSWSNEEILDFNWNIQDTVARYNFKLFISHSVDLQFQNIYLKCLTLFPDSSAKEQILSLELFQPNGTPFGQCSGNSCETEIPLIENTKFRYTGNYGLRIEQYGRDSILQGVELLRLQIAKIP